MEKNWGDTPSATLMSTFHDVGKIVLKKGLAIRSYKLYAPLLSPNCQVKNNASKIQDFTVCGLISGVC